jgi:hypothetical protein
MSTIAMKTESCGQSCAGKAESGSLTGFQRYILRRCHPASIFAEVAGFHWVLYFIWQNLWVEAIATFVGFRLLSVAVSWRADAEEISRTLIGKVGLLHLDPVNVVVQLVGFAIIVAGLWSHDVKFIMAGLSLLFLGHLRGWGKVAKEFEAC